MTHAELVVCAYNWVKMNTKCGVVLREYRADTGNGEEPDVIGFGPRGLSVVVECKVSRADFFADKNKDFRIHSEQGMGGHRYYCCPESLLTVNDLPDKLWGLIHVADNGSEYSPYIVHDPYENDDNGRVTRRFERNISAEISVMYSVLHRLDLRGRIEEVYDKLSVGAISRARANQTNRCEVGEVWVKKLHQNQVYEIIEAGEHTVRLMSRKTLASENLPYSKFYQNYQKGLSE